MSGPAASAARPDAAQVIAGLRALRRGPRDASFWRELATALAALARARAAMVIAPEGGGWRQLGLSEPSDGWLQAHAGRLLGELSPKAAAQGHATSAPIGDAIAACVRLFADEGEVFALFEIPARERASLGELMIRLQLIADLPMGGAAGVQERATGEADRPPAATPEPSLLELLDLVARVMQEKRFGAAALALVNGLVPVAGCDQVVLGWRQVSYVRARAISHLDRFERKAETVQLLEAALEEALDQQSDIAYPSPDGQGAVVLAHERMSRALDLGRVRSLLLGRADRAPEAVVMLANRGERPLAERSHQLVSVALHLLMPWLADLQERDRWLGARLWTGLLRSLRDWFALEKPARGLATVATALLLGFAVFGTWPHRIEANAELATDSTQLISAPFDGFVQEVRVALGDEVARGDELAALDVRELYLQESEIRADLRRFEAEADRARAAREPAEVEIARARVAQAQARLEKVLFRLQQAAIRAPFEGVVVEGDRRDLAGMPVRQGDRMFRIARVEGLYAVLQMPERDIRYLGAEATGELRLLSAPGEGIPFTVENVVPVTQVKGAQGNHFAVRVRLDADAQAWWRPGMSGMALVDAGERPIVWLLTRRLVDMVRMKLWL